MTASGSGPALPHQNHERKNHQLDPKPALRDIPSPGSILDGNTGSLLSGNLQVAHRYNHMPTGFVDIDAVAEKALLPKPDVEVCLHGFVEDEEGQHYSDDPEEITGWCVYLRRNEPDKGNHPVMSYFDCSWTIIDEWDFADSGAAKGFARRMAADYGTTVFAY